MKAEDFTPLLLYWQKNDSRKGNQKRARCPFPIFEIILRPHKNVQFVNRLYETKQLISFSLLDAIL